MTELMVALEEHPYALVPTAMHPCITPGRELPFWPSAPKAEPPGPPPEYHTRQRETPFMTENKRDSAYFYFEIGKISQLRSLPLDWEKDCDPSGRHISAACSRSDSGNSLNHLQSCRTSMQWNAITNLHTSYSLLCARRTG